MIARLRCALWGHGPLDFLPPTRAHGHSYRQRASAWCMRCDRCVIRDHPINAILPPNVEWTGCQYLTVTRLRRLARLYRCHFLGHADRLKSVVTRLEDIHRCRDCHTSPPWMDDPTVPR